MADTARTVTEATLLALLSEPERRQRAALMAEAGGFAQAMRRVERAAYPAPLMLAEVWRHALWLIASKGLALHTTVARYGDHIAAFAGYLVDAATADDWQAPKLETLERWQKRMAVEQRIGPRQRSVAVSAVKSFYAWRSPLRGKANPAAALRTPKIVKRVPRRYSRRDVRAIFRAIEVMAETRPLQALRDRAIVLLIYTTGMRASEVADLTPEQIILRGTSGKLADVRIFGKGAKERTVSLEGPALVWLLRWLDERDRDHRVDAAEVFTSLKTANRVTFGDRLNRGAIYNLVRTHCVAGGVKGSGVHRMRVTFATQLYDDGFDLERIRVLMGHESIETTRRYLSLSDRQHTVRMAAHHQHDVLGDAPSTMPRWARKKLNLPPTGDIDE